MPANKGSHWTPAAKHTCFILRYKLDTLFYFVHAKSWSNARWVVIHRHKRAYGYTGLLVNRFGALDNVPITRERLSELGYTQVRGDKTAPICTCALCIGGGNEEKAG